MHPLAHELDDLLQRLDAARAKHLEHLVREAMNRVSQSSNGWPEGYFEATAGALADEPFKRASQGDYTTRESW